MHSTILAMPPAALYFIELITIYDCMFVGLLSFFMSPHPPDYNSVRQGFCQLWFLAQLLMSDES
jgi:hypothetical protein